MNPKVTIIVPIYKASDFIDRCAHSLFSQTLDDLQFIFVDDCTPDDSINKLLSVLDKYPSRRHQVFIYRHETNKGVSAARNTGITHANGEFVAFCDSDDFVDVNMYKELYNHAIKTNADAVLCDFYMYYSDDYKEINVTPFNPNKDEFLLNYVAYNWTMVWNILAKKEIYENNIIQFRTQFSYCEDFHVAFRLLYACGTISKISLPYYFYNRSNENSAMHKLNDKMSRDERSVYLDLIDFLINDNNLEKYIEVFSWRILKNKQDLVLDHDKHDEFMSIFPVSSKFIISCPTSFCNNKIKLLMWLLTHHCRFILLMILSVRNFWK